MRRHTQLAVIILILLVILIGIAIMVYPLSASWYAERTRSQVYSEYQAVINTVDTTHIDAALTAAEAWNQGLFSGQFDPLQPESNGYFEQLDLMGTGIMGYIKIPKIGVELPIYHGTGDNVLAIGAGHMPQSSLPIGGNSTHAVISAHSGASSPMFSDLELLKIGDTFEIEVLGDLLTYQVDNIQVVLPVEVTAVQIENGRDLVTLVTCTPYGINTHRLLVRGHRIPTPDPVEDPQPVYTVEETETKSVWLTAYWESIRLGLLIAGGFIFLTIFLLIVRKKREDHRRE